MTRIVSFVFVCTILATGTHSVATDSERDLRIAVSNMNDWLGADENARRWRRFLDLNILDTQSALGHRADPIVLSKIHDKFRTDYAGLKHPVFRRVSNCLEAHIAQLSKNQNDILQTAEKSKANFANLSLEDLQRMRDDVIFRIERLRRYYQRQLQEADRETLFSAIQLEESLDYLKSMTFELPTNRTEEIITREIGEINLEIEKVETQLKELNEQIEKINQWKENLNRPDGVDPPSPDDAQSNDTADSNLNSNQQDDIKKIQNGQMVLETRKQELQGKVGQLEAEKAGLKNNEADRLERFRAWRSEYAEFANRYLAIANSQDDSYFIQALGAINRLRRAYFAAANPRTESDLTSRIESFQNEYEKFSDSQDRRAAAKIGYLTGWMDAAGQATDLVAAVRAQHSHPNLFFEISDNIVNEFAGQKIDECRRVNEVILSRLIRGIAHVEGAGKVRFVPDFDQARIAIESVGTINSDTYTRSGKLTAYAGAFADFHVQQELFANVGGMFANDVCGDINLDSYFKCIDSKLRIVQRIARKQFHKTEALAECISGERTRKKIMDQFRVQTKKVLADGYDRVATLKQRQVEKAKWLPSMFLFTTDDRLVAVGHHGTMYNLAANNHPRKFDDIPADVRMKLNETMLSNFLSPLFAGRRMTNRQLAEEFAQLLDREPKEPENDQDFNVQFDEARPFQFEFDDNLFGLTITGVFQRAGSRSRNNLRIELKFKLQSDGDIVQLVPAEKVNIELVDPTKKNIGTASMVSFLERIMTDLINDSKDSNAALPANLLPTEKLEPEVKKIADQLVLTQIRSEDGWMYAGWKHQTNDQTFTGLVDKPALFAAAENQPESDAVDLEDALDVSDQINNQGDAGENKDDAR